MSSAFLLVLHAASTWALVGLIWIVQLVHYPLFDGVGAAEFSEYHARHGSLITWIVGPLMGLELATGIWLVLRRPAEVPAAAAWAGLALIALHLASTAFVQIPLHRLLGAGWDRDVIQRLVLTNWLRTVAWTVRGLLVGWLLWRCLRSGSAGLG